MRQFFYQLLIGYIFIIIDLNFGIDIVPDIIGFIIIARAIQKYATSKYNKTAILLSYASGIISLIEMPLLYSVLESFPYEVNLLYVFISNIIQLLFYYYIFGVFFSFVQDTPHVNYTKKIKHLVVGSLWFMITFLYIAEHTRNLIIGLLFLVAGIVAVIGVIMFFVYCYKMMKYGESMEFQEKQEQVEPS
ncbi:hypothetical protein H9635_04045 [Solibacillus sp. A46]|uniref:DUF308 domain-containing protein n=1 Tax=Solibacillus faecavium TaxID=2762221 RepID=A0ABR8XVE4_9BACL|nr:hypothetical protein [Solibacillus faecavium]MBD8035900.1 hypothetical protein [Solibacillus faecavium]